MRNPQRYPTSQELSSKFMPQDDLSKAFSVMIDDNEEFWYKLIQSNKIDEEFIKSLANLEKNQLEHIRSAIAKNVDIEKIKLFSKPEFTCFQMEEILNACLAEISFEKIKILANPSLPHDEMKEMVKAYRFGLSLEDAPSFVALSKYDKRSCAHELEKKEQIRKFHKLLKKD